MKANNTSNVIERDIHCPFCDGNGALLISGLTEQTSTIGTPSDNLRIILRNIFTAGFSLWVDGFPWVAKKREYKHTTYGFCPHCGNSFSAIPPEVVPEEKPKLRRDVANKKIKGICAGVAKYTGLPVKWCRLILFLELWCTLGLFGVIYLLAGIFIPAEEDDDTITS
jgi:phage shock protein PspC (stress-responsive transcriptional regulator)